MTTHLKPGDLSTINTFPLWLWSTPTSSNRVGLMRPGDCALVIQVAAYEHNYLVMVGDVIGWTAHGWRLEKLEYTKLPLYFKISDDAP